MSLDNDLQAYLILLDNSIDRINHIFIGFLNKFLNIFLISIEIIGNDIVEEGTTVRQVVE